MSRFKHSFPGEYTNGVSGLNTMEMNDLETSDASDGEPRQLFTTAAGKTFP